MTAYFKTALRPCAYTLRTSSPRLAAVSRVCFYHTPCLPSCRIALTAANALTITTSRRIADGPMATMRTTTRSRTSPLTRSRGAARSSRTQLGGAKASKCHAVVARDGERYAVHTLRSLCEHDEISAFTARSLPSRRRHPAAHGGRHGRMERCRCIEIASTGMSSAAGHMGVGRA